MDGGSVCKSGNILIVDDTPENLKVLSGMLRQQGFKARPAPSGKLALQAVASEQPDLILLDINMPEMNGYEVCRRLKEDPRFREIPVIFISALTELEDKIKAFTSGGLDYITKPFQFEEVSARVRTHLHLRHCQVELERHNHALEDLVQEKVREISLSQIATIFALAKLSESRDNETGGHIERVRVYCKVLAEALSSVTGFEETVTPKYVENIYHASPLHDIGKVGIPDAILLKPGKLTNEEFETMKKHSAVGADTLEAVRVQYPKNALVAMGTAIARSHHEKWNGSGYPDGIAGDKIPVSARIMALADVYDALRSKRHYKDAFSHEKSKSIILEGAGTHFDPAVVEMFVKMESEFQGIHERMND